MSHSVHPLRLSDTWLCAFVWMLEQSSSHSQLVDFAILPWIHISLLFSDQNWCQFNQTIQHKIFGFLYHNREAHLKPHTSWKDWSRKWNNSTSKDGIFLTWVREVAPRHVWLLGGSRSRHWFVANVLVVHPNTKCTKSIKTITLSLKWSKKKKKKNSYVFQNAKAAWVLESQAFW